MAPRRILVLMTFAMALAFVGAGGSAVAQQGNEARFPDAARVAADFADPAERYVAFEFLYDTLRETTSGVPSAKRNAYYDAMDQIRRQDSAAVDAAGPIRVDQSFRNSVVAKYGLTALPTESVPTIGSADSRLLTAAVVALVALTVSWVIMRRVVRRTVLSAGNAALHPAAESRGDLPLPDALRTVEVAGRQYTVAIESGRVVDKDVALSTSVHTTTTAGQAYAVGSQVHYTPGHTHTTVSQNAELVLWVQAADGRETSWTLPGGTFRARNGQMVSTLKQQLAGGSGELLIAFNHATGQLEPLRGIERAHVTSGGRAAWCKSTLIGSIGVGLAFWVLLRLDTSAELHSLVGVLSVWIEGAIAAGVAAAFMVASAKRRIFMQRNAWFTDHYMPAFQRILEEATPTLGQRFRT